MNYKKMSKAELINELESLKSRLEVAGVSGKSKDITEHKRAEDEIKGLAKFPSENPNPVMRVFNDGNILYHNKASTFLLDTWGCRTTKMLPDNYIKIVSDVLHSGLSSVAETECSRGRIISLTFAPVVEEGYVNIYGMDITERKKAEENIKTINESLEQRVVERTEKLKESEEKYRRLMETAKDAILCDINGIITDWNKSAEELFGYSKDEIMGKSVSILVPEKYKKEHQEGLERFLKTGESRMIGKTMEVSGITKEGAEIPIEISLTAQKIEEEKYSFMAIARDITERKRAEVALRESEKNLSLIHDTVRDTLFRIGVEHNDCFRFLSFNKAGLNATGLTEKQIVGKRIEEVIPESSHALVLDKYKEAIRENKTVKWEETSTYPAGERNGEVTITPVLNEDGVCTHLIGSVHDITERKKAEELLQEQKKALEQKNIALSEILGQIEIEKKQIKDNVVANAENLLLPVIQKLKLTGESRKYVQLLQKNLEELTSSFGTKLTGKRAKLTSREIEICNMIKNGLTNKEIALLLNISLATIERHRANIRKKLGIIKKDINLSSFLKTL